MFHVIAYLHQLAQVTGTWQGFCRREFIHYTGTVGHPGYWRHVLICWQRTGPGIRPPR